MMVRNLVCTVCGRKYVHDSKLKKGYTLTLCNSCVVNRRRFRVKQKAIAYKGGKCTVCSYAKCTAALEFHHVVGLTYRSYSFLKGVIMVGEFRDDYAFLSNFHPCWIVYECRVFKSAEAAYQSAKTFDSGIKEQFCRLGPGSAKKFGKTIELRPDWAEVKLQVMLDVLRLKFYPGSELADKLLATGTQHLCEGNNWNDLFWGVSLTTHEGKNHLGELLMQLRVELKVLYAKAGELEDDYMS